MTWKPSTRELETIDECPGDEASLEALALKFGLGNKTVSYGRMDGVHPRAMSEELLQECGRGAANDCSLTLHLFRHMLNDGFPRAELPIIDMTVQMFTNPRLAGNAGALRALQQAELDKRAQLPRRHCQRPRLKR